MRPGLISCCAAILASLLLVALLPATAWAQSSGWMTGRFTSDFGNISLSPTGGSYDYKGGRLQVTQVSGAEMRGIWRQTESGQRCRDGGYWGRFHFKFTPAGFSGTYTYCDGATAGAWNGRRIGPPAPTGGAAADEPGWGVWASASGGRWSDPCAILYNAARLAGNRYDTSPVYRRVRTRKTQSEADLDIDHFGRFHRNQPDGVVKMAPCDPNGSGGKGGANISGGGAASWIGTFEGGGFRYQVTGSGNTLTISYTSSRVTQSGSHRCTVSGNKATCRGAGTYSDKDKTIPYNDSWQLSLNGDTISGTWRIEQSNVSWRVAPYPSGLDAGTGGSMSMQRVR